MSILKDFHDQSFEDDVNFKEFEEKKIITKQEDKNLYHPKTKMTRVLKTRVEREWFNTRKTFHLYYIGSCMIATWHTCCVPPYVHACMPFAVIHCVLCHITLNNNNTKTNLLIEISGCES